MIQGLALGSSGSSGDEDAVIGISGFQAVESLSACQVGFQGPTQQTSWQDTRQKPNTKAKLLQNLPTFHWGFTEISKFLGNVMTLVIWYFPFLWKIQPYKILEKKKDF